MESQGIIFRLTSEFGYTPKGATIVANQLARLDPGLEIPFLTWLGTGDIPEVSVEDYSLASLIHDHKMNPIAAFLTLDWLIREPTRARASLRRGHDFIGPRDS